MKVIVEKKTRDITMHHNWYNPDGEVTACIDIEYRNLRFKIGEDCYVIPLAIIKGLEHESVLRNEETLVNDGWRWGMVKMKVVVQKPTGDATERNEVTAFLDIVDRNLFFKFDMDCYVIPLVVIKGLEIESELKNKQDEGEKGAYANITSE